MPGPFQTFSGSPVAPGQVAYTLFTLTSSITIGWPNFTAAGTNVYAVIMDITANAGTYAITMPDARQAGNGTTALFRNTGAQTIEIKANDGSTITTIGAGVAKFLYLSDNTTQAGTWGLVTFGTGTSSADASLLAGYGLQAIAATLNQAHPTVATGATINVTSPADLAKVYVATGGSVTANLPGASAVGDKFFVIIKNAGSGTVTITPNGADTIDGVATLALAPNDAAMICSLGSLNGWVSVGWGRSVIFAFTQLVKSVAGSSDVTLTSAECANKVMKFTGVLTGNINVIVTSTVSVYYLSNDTTGSFTLTVKTAAGAGVVVVQGADDIVVCDGTDVTRAVTSTAATTLFPAGSASAPSITFIGSTGTGLFMPTLGVLGASANGFQVMSWNSPASAVNWIDQYSSATGVAPRTEMNGSDPSVGYTIKLKGTGAAAIFSLQDGSGATMGTWATVASALNWLAYSAGATGVYPKYTSMGETNVGVRFVMKGTGTYQIADGTDPTKIAEFVMSAIGTGTTRTFTFPNSSGVLVTEASTQTLSNKTLTSPIITTSPTAAGATWASLGTVTTIDINGGTIDGAVIGGAAAAAGTFTTAIANSFVPNSATVPSNGMYLPSANVLGWAINSATEMQLAASALLPSIDGGLALGTTANAWQSLFGNTGFVLNIENGDWVATHTTGILTVGTGDLRVTTAGTNTASVVTVGGTQTLTGKSLTSPTITGTPTAVGATWTNLGTVTTIDINGGTIDGTVIGGVSPAAVTGTLVTGRTAGTAGVFQNTQDAASVQSVQFHGDRATMADNDEAYASLMLSDDGGSQAEFARITWVATDVNVGTSLDGRLDFSVMTAGALAKEMQLDGTALSPSADGGLSLGTTTLGWQNLHGNTGFVLNIDNSNWVATHTSGILTVGTGDLRVTTAGTNTASVVTVGGTQTLTAKTLTAPVLSSPVIAGASVPTDGIYLPAANTLGFAVASTGEMQMTGTALSPITDGGLSLGTTALGWQNLFGNTGFVLNIEAGNWVATHTSGILTVGTGDLRVTTAGTNTASVVTVGGTQTLTGKTLTTPIISSISNTGTLTLPTSTDTLVGRATTDTLTNKRMTWRVVSMADSNTITPTGDTADMNTTANTQALATLTIAAPSGTPTDGQRLVLRIKSTNAHAISWNAIYRGGTDFALPTPLTGASETDFFGLIYHATDAKWDLVAYTPGFN